MKKIYRSLVLCFFLTAPLRSYAALPAEDVGYALDLLKQIDSSRLSRQDEERLKVAAEKLGFALIAMKQNQPGLDLTSCANQALQTMTPDDGLEWCVEHYKKTVTAEECFKVAHMARFIKDNLVHQCMGME